MKKIPPINDFQEFPLSEKEIEQILFTMRAECIYVIDAKRYEQVQKRYDERMSR